MSKVKIQGNASGTGVVTLTAPNTNTDRTITLPDGDISLGGGVDGIVSTANATAITIDSSENVGIGTSSPSTNMQLSGSNSANGFNLAVDTDNATRSARLFLSNSTSGQAISMRNEAGELLIATGGTVGSSSGAERMRINSAGIVTMPYQPAFYARGVSFLAADGITFLGTQMDVNNGSHFSTTTGKFTAPVAGLYTFTFDLTTNDTNSHFVDIYKNGTLVGGHMLTYNVVYQEGSNSVIVSLAVGDYVTAGRRTSAYGVYNAHFSGHLIG